MIVDSIKNGIVIDHIKAGNGMQLFQILELDRLDCTVAIMKNVSSAKMGKKDIIKINEIINLNLDVLGYIDPGITVNIIEDSVRVKKLHMELPETVSNVIKCKNPRCITSTEQELQHKFRLQDRASRTYCCIYCDTEAEKRVR